MPGRLPGEIRRKVVMLWILGYTLDYIAAKSGASLGSVRNIVEELRHGRIAEYEGFVEYLEELRWLSQQLKTSNLTLQDAALGIITFNAMHQLSLNPAEVPRLLAVLRRVSPSDFPIQQFVRATLQIAKLESGTKMSFEQLEAKAGSLGSEVAALEAKKAELGRAIISLKSTEEEARAHLDYSLAQYKATTQVLEEYATNREILRKAGLNIDRLKPLSDFVEKATNENALNVALELSRLESQTGKDSVSILEDYKQKIRRNARLDEEYSRLGKEIDRYKGEIRQLGLERQKQAILNATTEDQLRSYVAIRSRLAARGIAIETLGVLEGIVNEFEKYGWQPAKMIRYVEQIGDLEQRTRQAKEEFAVVGKEVAAQRATHQLTRDKMRDETVELERLKEAEEQSRTKLDQMQRQTSDNFLQIDFADTLLRLLSDSATVKDEQLLRLVEKLQLVLRTRRTVQGLYVDYEPLRQQLILLLEIVLGKKLVTRDMMEEQTRSLKNLVTDLTLDRMGKLQKDQNKLNSDRRTLLWAARKVEQERLAFETASDEELLALSVARAKKGALYLLVCKSCGYREACQLGSKQYTSQIRSCPCCYSTLVPRDLVIELNRLSRSKRLPHADSVQ